MVEEQFAALRTVVEKALQEVTEALEVEERRAVQRADGIQTHLEKKLAEVQRASGRAEKLSKNKNDIVFLEVEPRRVARSNACRGREHESQFNVLPFVCNGRKCSDTGGAF